MLDAYCGTKRICMLLKNRQGLNVFRCSTDLFLGLIGQPGEDQLLRSRADIFSPACSATPPAVKTPHTYAPFACNNTTGTRHIEVSLCRPVFFSSCFDARTEWTCALMALAWNARRLSSAQLSSCRSLPSSPSHLPIAKLDFRRPHTDTLPTAPSHQSIRAFTFPNPTLDARLQTHFDRSRCRGQPSGTQARQPRISTLQR